MKSATQILKEATEEIEYALSIIKQSMKVVEILSENGRGDTQLCDFFRAAAADLAASIEKKYRITQVEVAKSEILREMKVFSGHFATFRRKLSMGQ